MEWQIEKNKLVGTPIMISNLLERNTNREQESDYTHNLRDKGEVCVGRGYRLKPDVACA